MEKNRQSRENNNHACQSPLVDKSVYVPDDVYHAFHNAYFKMEMANKEFHKLREEMEPV